MPDLDLVVVGGRVILPAQGEVEATIGITDGQIVSVTSGAMPPARDVIDAGGKVVFPGVVDPHTHVTLGPPDGWFTETRAAAVAGITTLLDFQLTSKSYVDGYQALRDEAGRRAAIDFGFHFCPSVKGISTSWTRG
jgi:dihydroorotase-like cyclic amidohydrolase